MRFQFTRRKESHVQTLHLGLHIAGNLRLLGGVGDHKTRGLR